VLVASANAQGRIMESAEPDALYRSVVSGCRRHNGHRRDQGGERRQDEGKPSA